MSGSAVGTARGRAQLSYSVGLALLVAAMAVGIAEPLAALLRIVPLDPNEGWNALFGAIATGGGTLYPAAGSLIVNNYPPLSFYIVGGIGHWVGDNILAGRVIALASMIIVALNIALWLEAVGSARRYALFGAAVFLAFAVTYARPYAAIDDPQWLAHAIMTTGLVVLWRGKASTRAILLGALLIMAGGFTKHLLIPIPLAVTWWLARRSRRAVLIWLAASAVLLIAAGGCVEAVYGRAFFDSLRSARQYSTHQALQRSYRALKCFAPLLALSLALLPRLRRHEGREFALLYLLVAGAVGVAASGGIGVDLNAFFDLMIAGSVCAALAVDALAVDSGGAVAPALVLAVGVYLAAYAATLAPGEWREYQRLEPLEAETRAATTLIAARGAGRAACETPELCYWAKNPFTFDFFNYGQRLYVGKEPMSACEALFDGRTFPLLQLDPNKGRGGSFQLPEGCNAVIRRHYRPIQVSSLGEILVPIDTAPSQIARR